jgi:hypothetical protein
MKLQFVAPTSLLTVLLFCAMASHCLAEVRSITVAAYDSPEETRSSADFCCTGVDDQLTIRQAILALPSSGGTVQLSAGNFEIHKVPQTLGGIIIDRSFVTLAGQGVATRLRLAAGQNTNVIRIIGSGVGHVTIRDLAIDANRTENDQGAGDPNLSHDRFEFCGIKAFRQAPAGPSADEDCHDITIRNCQVKEAHRLGIMLEGSNMRVLDNVLGDAGSDVVEILTGPGIIRGNMIDIVGKTHVAIGTDRANNIIMADNVVRVRTGASLDIGFRSWAGSLRHSISGNVLAVDNGGACGLAMDLRGMQATVTGNVISAAHGTSRVKIGGGQTTLTGNVLENITVEIDDTTELNLPVLLGLNSLRNSQVELKRGVLEELDSKKPVEK